MTLGLVKNSLCRVRQYYSLFAYISRVEIRPQVISVVNLVIADDPFNLLQESVWACMGWQTPFITTEHPLWDFTRHWGRRGGEGKGVLQSRPAICNECYLSSYWFDYIYTLTLIYWIHILGQAHLTRNTGCISWPWPVICGSRQFSEYCL